MQQHIPFGEHEIVDAFPFKSLKVNRCTVDRRVTGNDMRVGIECQAFDVAGNGERPFVLSFGNGKRRATVVCFSDDAGDAGNG